MSAQSSKPRYRVLIVPALEVDDVVVGERTIAHDGPRERLVPLGVQRLLDDGGLFLLIILLAVATERNGNEWVREATA